MHHCKVCNKYFKKKHSFDRHNVSVMHIRRLNDKDMQKYYCECGKYYVHQQSLYNHKMKCGALVVRTDTQQHLLQLQEDMKKQKKEFDDKIKSQNESFLKEREKIKEEFETRMKEQMSLLLDKYADAEQLPVPTVENHQTIETQQNIENQNNIDNLTNIVVNINSFGNENIEYLDDDTVIDCIKQLHNSVPAIIEKVHFHPKHPENHNIKVTNKKLPYAKVMGKNQKWKTMNRSDAIDRMITNGYNILDDTYEEHKDKLSEFKQTVFEDFQKKYLDDDKQTHKKLRTNVDTLILNEGSS